MAASVVALATMSTSGPTAPRTEAGDAAPRRCVGGKSSTPRGRPLFVFFRARTEHNVADGNARATASPCSRSSQDVMRPRKVILCVDDNEQALSVRKFMLETRGYRVVTALNAEEALEVFRAGGVDLVLSDLIMPQMDGNELVRRMKDIAPEVPMILLSGTVKTFDRASHADAFLPKGACTPLEMLERIRVMIARKRGPKKATPRPFYQQQTTEIASIA